MVDFRRDGGYVVIDCRQPVEVEAAMPPDQQGRVFWVNFDHRVGWRYRIWQFWCEEKFHYWIASCANWHSNNYPCVHCYDFQDRADKHNESGWILTCKPCARQDTGEATEDPINGPKPKAASRGGFGQRRGPRSTKTTGAILQLKF